jgi:hypothetical protein
LTPVAGFADHPSIEKGVHTTRVSVFGLSLAIDGTDVSWSA